MFNLNPDLQKPLFILCAALCLLPFIDPAMALGLGVVLAIIIGHPFQDLATKAPKMLLPLCVVGLGAAMDLEEVAKLGLHGLGYTVMSITLSMAAGLILARLFQLEKQVAWLMSAGTAICGGSAIAALAPVIQARSTAIAVSLAVVFILNALALVVFPPIGEAFHLTQHQFGLWAALAIHDTSSVVGAGLKFGPESLQTATAVKLVRALWIVPLVLIIGALYKKEEGVSTTAKRKYPWFILGFLVMAALVTYIPLLQPAGEWVAFAAKRGLVLTLFFIGAGLDLQTLKETGAKPFLMGTSLWVLVSAVSLAAICLGWIG